VLAPLRIEGSGFPRPRRAGGHWREIRYSCGASRPNTRVGTAVEAIVERETGATRKPPDLLYFGRRIGAGGAASGPPKTWMTSADVWGSCCDLRRADEAINTVRKHISAVKGARLATAARHKSDKSHAGRRADVGMGKESAWVGAESAGPGTVGDTKAASLTEYSYLTNSRLPAAAGLMKGKCGDAESGSTCISKLTFFLLLGNG